MVRNYIRTVDDLVKWTYSLDPTLIAKADNPLLTGTTGVYNPIFGAKVKYF